MYVLSQKHYFCYTNNILKIQSVSIFMAPPHVKKSSTARSFATKSYPTFGRRLYDDTKPPKSVTNSPFYWWFKFLQLNDEYAARATPDLALVHQDLGDVRGKNFKLWWNEHSELFAEPRTSYSLRVARALEELAPFNDAGVVNLVVPLGWTNVGIKRRFGALIDKLVPKTKRGVHVEGSHALYRLGRKWSVQGMANAYAMLLQERRAEAERAHTGKKVSLADMAIRANLHSAKGLREGLKTTATSDQRRIVTIIAVRHLKNAKRLLAASGSKVFPN